MDRANMCLLGQTKLENSTRRKLYKKAKCQRKLNQTMLKILPITMREIKKYVTICRSEEINEAGTARLFPLALVLLLLLQKLHY
jgi:hypothetical protein